MLPEDCEQHETWSNDEQYIIYLLYIIYYTLHVARYTLRIKAVFQCSTKTHMRFCYVRTYVRIRTECSEHVNSFIDAY